MEGENVRVKEYAIRYPNRIPDTWSINKMSYLDNLIDVVRCTDKENWERFSETEKEIALEFLKSGDLTRVIVLIDYEKKTSIPVAYVQLSVLKKRAESLLVNDLFHKLSIPFEDLFLPSSEIDNETSFYINVVAIKQSHQGSLKLIAKLAEAIEHIIQSTSPTPQAIYAVGVTDSGNRMCELMCSDRRYNYLGAVVRTNEGLTNTDSEHKRAVYRYSTFEFLNNLQKFLPKNCRKK